jgi:hypothetical protein
LSWQLYPFRLPQSKTALIFFPIPRYALHDDIDVVRHEAEAVNATIELLDGILQHPIKPVPVTVFKEDWISCVATKNDMVDSAGIVDAWFSCQG